MRASWWSMILVLGACKPAAKPVAPVETTASPGATTGSAPTQASPPVAVASGEDVTGAGAPLPAADDARRQEGLHAFDEGRYSEARRIFAELLRRHRSNGSLQALATAAERAEQEARAGAATTLARMPTLDLPQPPWKYTLRHAAELPAKGPVPKLVQRSRQRNSITDDDRWFAANGLAMPEWKIPNPRMGVPGDLPSQVPDHYGDLPIVRAISHPDHAVLLYGPDYSGGTVLAVVQGDGQVRALWDFDAWRTAPTTASGDADFVDQRIVWAQAVGNVVFVSTGHRTYARSSGGDNAYITALDLDTGDILWRSQPLVANAANFHVRDGWIVTGYGFTAEPDFLYVLDATNGKVAAKHKLESGPDVILEKDGQLFVRCYDTDYVFDVK